MLSEIFSDGKNKLLIYFNSGGFKITLNLCKFKSQIMNKVIVVLIASLCFCVAMAQKFEPKWVGEVVILNCSEDTIAIPH